VGICKEDVDISRHVDFMVRSKSKGRHLIRDGQLSRYSDGEASIATAAGGP